MMKRLFFTVGIVEEARQETYLENVNISRNMVPIDPTGTVVLPTLL